MKQIKTFTTILFFAFICSGISAQNPSLRIVNPYNKKTQKTEVPATTNIEEMINQFFQYMKAGDTSALGTYMLPDTRLTSTGSDQYGNPKIQVADISGWMNQVASSKPGDLDEKVTNIRTQINQSLGTAWMDYTFYYKGQFSHCGVNAFQLFLDKDRWKIIQISDTRSKECKPDDETVIGGLLDDWHKAAATADENVYFNFFTNNGVFLGTDETERWNVTEFKKWSEEYFKGESAWDFTATERNIILHENGEIAWFDENLSTWMGPCRGSGVLIKSDSGWKLEHYNLAMLVPNDLIEDYVKLLKK